MRFGSRDVGALGLVLALIWLAYGFVLDLQLMGWDSYPILAASDPAELGTSLFDRWMGGRYPRGEFYRPLSTLSFAADRSLWGLSPRGFQLSNWLTLLFASGCSYGLVRAWFGSRLAATVAALCFALHAAQLEAVPVMARRSDLLAAGLMAAALWAQPLDAGASRARLVLGAVLIFFASAAKETGVAVLPAIVVLHCALANRETGRLRAGLVRSAPAIAAVVGFIALRTAVLGGLGGHPDSNLLGGALAGALAAPLWLAVLIMPQPWTESFLDFPLACAAWLALAAAASRALRDSRFAAALLALAAWAASLLLMMGISGDRASWYLVPLLGPYVLLLGGLVAFAHNAREAGAKGRGVAAVCALLFVAHIATSPLVRDYPAWRQASTASERFLAAFDAAVESHPEPSTIALAGLPLGTGVPLERIGVRSALGLSDYSVAAYAELRFPARSLDVVARGASHSERDPAALRIELTPAPGPMAAAWQAAQP